MNVAKDASALAEMLRPASRHVFAGTGKLCLSTDYLNHLTAVLDDSPDEMSASFHTLQQQQRASVDQQLDLQFLRELLHKTTSLKVVTGCAQHIDMSKLENVTSLELVGVGDVVGLQRLQLRQIAVAKCARMAEAVLGRSWTRRHTASFARNGLVRIDAFMAAAAPMLHTLDLSHNRLQDVSALSHLPSLKYLNVSYNRLEGVPAFRGSICTTLRTLTLSNNFIEHVAGLGSLVNIVQVDLGHNCILDHKSLIAVSHLACLQMLNMSNNPIGFHPHHRNMVCGYLNKNTATTRFSLDGNLLTNSEKQLVGQFHPMVAPLLQTTPPEPTERSRRIRNVTINDIGGGGGGGGSGSGSGDDNDKETPSLENTEAEEELATSTQHLAVKKQVEHLRKEYGESWLHNVSGLMMQDVLGLERHSTPYGSAAAAATALDSALDTFVMTEEQKSDAELQVAQDEKNVVEEEEEEEEEESDEEDIYLGGEQGIYLAHRQDGREVFVVVTAGHISERDCATSKECARWHVNTMQRVEEEVHEVHEEHETQEGPPRTAVVVTFDTVRRDRKHRRYEVEQTEARNLVEWMRAKIAERGNATADGEAVVFKCMKCSKTFRRNRVRTMGEPPPPVECVNCDSKMVIVHDDDHHQ